MNVHEICNDVMQLDLDLIKTKLMHVESGEGWSLEKANAVEKEYRRFLCLMKLYPHDDTAPLVDVDTFWHYHILDTMKYAADCEKAFGYFLHHYPYVGMRGGDDEQFRLDSGKRMGELYEATFGEPYPGNVAQADASAYCAGPWHDKAKGQPQTAYCAGPWHDEAKAAPATTNAVGSATAYCAGPWHDHVKAQTAYCAGPWHDKAKAAPTTTNAVGSATAYCAGPWHDQVKAQTAYCAGPWHDKAKAASATTGVVGSATAYCAGPWHDQVKARTAYCAGPWHDKAKAAADAKTQPA